MLARAVVVDFGRCLQRRLFLRVQNFELSAVLLDDSLAEVAPLGKFDFDLCVFRQLLAEDFDLIAHAIVVLDQGLHVLRVEVQLGRHLHVLLGGQLRGARQPIFILLEHVVLDLSDRFEHFTAENV